jgi:hypothetical protein
MSNSHPMYLGSSPTSSVFMWMHIHMLTTPLHILLLPGKISYILLYNITQKGWSNRFTQSQSTTIDTPYSIWTYQYHGRDLDQHKVISIPHWYSQYSKHPLRNMKVIEYLKVNPVTFGRMISWLSYYWSYVFSITGATTIHRYSQEWSGVV